MTLDDGVQSNTAQMDQKERALLSSTPVVSAIRAFGMFAVIATALAFNVHSNDADVLTSFRQSSTNTSLSAPLIVAQGRCYNGRCY